MLPDALLGVLTGPWGLVVMAVLVLGDAFTVVIPGEVAVTALGALAISHGAPPLWAVIVVAAVAAWAGDAVCFLIGRTVGVQRWRWMRTAKVRAALDAARHRLDRSAATVLFTARFVPFARLAVNLTAGASRLHPLRYLMLAGLAATGWAAYQAAVGALIAAVVPGGPVVAIVVSVVAAIVIGVLIDLVVTRVQRSRLSAMSEDKAVSPEEIKRKFKEALDKKNAQKHGGESHLDGDSAVHATNAPQLKREFRRKSG